MMPGCGFRVYCQVVLPHWVHLHVELEQGMFRMDADHHLTAITERLSRVHFRIDYVSNDKLVNQLLHHRNANVLQEAIDRDNFKAW